MNTKLKQSIQAIVFTILLFAFTHFSADFITSPGPVTIAYAQPDGESVQIQPLRWDDSQTVYSDQELVFTIGWGACQKGLVQNYLNAVNLAFNLDGQPVFASKEDTNQYWGPVSESPAGP